MAIAIWADLIGSLAFCVGFWMHGFLANKTKIYSARLWKLLMVASIITCLFIPLGTVMGAIALVLLFNLDTFRKMKTANQAMHQRPSLDP